MESEKAACRIVEILFLKPGRRITEVRQVGSTTRVRSDAGGWRIEPAVKIYSPSAQACRVFDVRADVAADPPPAPTGAALFPDGSIYLLNDPSQFGDFFQRVGQAAGAQVWMRLLARYQAGELPETVIADEETLDFWLGPKASGRIPQFTLPQHVEHQRDLLLAFCTLSLRADRRFHSPQVSLNRWQVEARFPDHLSWRVYPLADHLAGTRFPRVENREVQTEAP